jgi:hypothetical protein
MNQPFVLQFRSLGADYTMTIHPDLRLTVCLRDDPIPVVDLVALPSGIESLMLNFSADQRPICACDHSEEGTTKGGKTGRCRMIG